MLLFLNLNDLKLVGGNKVKLSRSERESGDKQQRMKQMMKSEQLVWVQLSRKHNLFVFL